MRRLRRSPSGARNLGVRSLRLDFVDFLFETQSRNNENLVRPGDALLAEDDIGSGHTWRMLDYQPWLRAYVSIGDKKTLNQTPRWVGTRSAEGLQAATRPRKGDLAQARLVYPALREEVSKLQQALARLAGKYNGHDLHPR